MAVGADAIAVFSCHSIDRLASIRETGDPVAQLYQTFAGNGASEPEVGCCLDEIC